MHEASHDNQTAHQAPTDPDRLLRLSRLHLLLTLLLSLSVAGLFLVPSQFWLALSITLLLLLSASLWQQRIYFRRHLADDEDNTASMRQLQARLADLDNQYRQAIFNEAERYNRLRDQHGRLLAQQAATDRLLTTVREDADQLRLQCVQAEQQHHDMLIQLSHAIRTRLNTLDGLGDLLLNSALDARQRDYVNTMRRGSEALLEHLAQTLATAGIGSDPVSRPATPTSATPALDEGQAWAAMAPVAGAELSVLLVDDHELNRKVTGLLLEHLGYQVDTVADGNSALAAVQKTTYDAILMDIQMPDIDGITTTRLIRQTVPTERQPRIIALTANTTRGDRDYYLQQGMDDYLAKPLSVEALQAALRDCVPAAQKTPFSPESPPPLLDPARLEHLRMMAGDEGDTLVREVVELFLSTAPEQLAAMQTHFATGDLHTTARIAHRIKSSSAAIGVDSLAHLCSAIEQKTREGNNAAVAHLIERSLQEYEHIERTLHETFLKTNND